MRASAPLVQAVHIVPAAPAPPHLATQAIADASGQLGSLAAQLANLEVQRVDLQSDLRSSDAAVRTTAQGQLREIDAQIAQTKAALKEMSAKLADQSGQVIVAPAPEPPFIYRNGPNAHDIEVMVLFAMAFVILLPIVIGIGRRIGRKGAAVSPGPDTISPRLDRMEQAIDAIAIEVERVSESQRFIAKLLADRGVAQVPAETGLGAGIGIAGARVRSPDRR